MNKETRRKFELRFHDLVCKEALGELTAKEAFKLDRYQRLRRSLLRCSGECPRLQWRIRLLTKTIRLFRRKQQGEAWSPVRTRVLEQIEGNQSQ